jgi:naphthoate synthase
MVGQKKAREIFFRRNYPLKKQWIWNGKCTTIELAYCIHEWAQEILGKSMAIKMLKFAMNLTDDGMVGQQVLQEKLLV